MIANSTLSNMEFASLETEATAAFPSPELSYDLDAQYTAQSHPAPNFSKTVLSLPAEILLRITYFLNLPPHRKPPYHGLCTSSKAPSPSSARTDTLRSLRLTHSLLSQLPNAYLFSHIRIPVWGEDGLLRLYNVASHDHLARHVQHLKVHVRFNVATPLAVSEYHINRDVEPDLLGRVPPPRKRDQLRRKVSEGVERLSLDRLKGKGRKQSLVTNDGNTVLVASYTNNDGIEAVRSGSTASGSSDPDQQPATTRRFPNPLTHPTEFLTMFDTMAASTISRQLGPYERDLPRSLENALPYPSMTGPGIDIGSGRPPPKPSPMLVALASLMCTVFSATPRLQTLCIDSETQEEFMGKLDRSFALRYTPMQETWEAMSSYIIGMLVASWAMSSTENVRRLWVLGGSTEWPDRIEEYLRLDSCASGPELWHTKAAKIDSLALNYDYGAYKKNLTAVERQWVPRITTFLTVMPNLQYLDLAAQPRSDSMRSGGVTHVSLANIVPAPSLASDMNQHTTSPSQSISLPHPSPTRNPNANLPPKPPLNPHLKLMRISDVSAPTPQDLLSALSTLTSPALQTLLLGSSTLTSPRADANWVTFWHMLRNTPLFDLKQFVFSGTRYEDTTGFWLRYPGKTNLDGRESLERRVRGWVEGGGRGEEDVRGGGGGSVRVDGNEEDGGSGGGSGMGEGFPLPLVQDVGLARAVAAWNEMSDEGMRYFRW